MKDIFEIIDDITVKPLVVSTRKSSGFYPSSASVSWLNAQGELKTEGACLRAEWYSAKSFPGTAVTSPQMEDKKAIGDWFSQRFVEKFKRAGLYVGDEVSFYHDDIGVSGRVDIIIKDPYKAPSPPARPLPKDCIGVEIKSLGGYMNTKGTVFSTKDTPLMPKIEHILQVMLYLDYYRNFGLNRWLIIYQDRESMEKSWHLVTLNETGNPIVSNDSGVKTLDFTIAMVKERYRQLKAAIDSNIIPNRDYALQYSNQKILDMKEAGILSKTDTEKINRILTKYKNVSEIKDPLITKGDWRCRYCAYVQTCWSNDPLRKTTPVPNNVAHTRDDIAETDLLV